MYVNAREKVGPCADVLVVNPETSEVMGLVFAANTEERWFEEYVIDEKTGKVVVMNFNKPNAALLTRRVDQATFDLVNRNTGEVLAESR